jgi:two-component system sensor histidine kinase/response regulator
MTQRKDKSLFQNNAAHKSSPETEDGNLFASNHADESPLFPDDTAQDKANDSPLFPDDAAQDKAADNFPLFAENKADKPTNDDILATDKVNTRSQTTQNDALLTAAEVLSQDTWKMLIVDDEEDVHQVTQLLLGDYVYQGKPLALFSAYSAKKAKALLAEHPDIAVILLDVVMESNDAGLRLVRYIRETLQNRFVRIILRTGQPGYAPEEDVIIEYDINDYANKTELTRQKLLTMTTASLRAYALFLTLESYRQNLAEKVAERTCELQHKNEQLTALNCELSKLNQDKNEFLSMAAHDLKNPLFAITGLAELIQLSIDDSSMETVEECLKEISEHAQMIATTSQQMYELIKKLLDVNAIESGKLKLSLKKLDLRQSLQTVVKNYLQRANAKNIHLQIQSPPQEYPIFADKIAIRQILENLVSNAIKYSPPKKNVIIRLTQNENEVLCEIQDEGPGLNEEEIVKLFRKFSRLGKKTTGGEHSSGLGLFIVKKLVEAMNGKVWCKSELGKGATFIVEFPYVMGNGSI